MTKPQPIRMCVSCRSRKAQSSLVRLKLDGKEMIAYDGKGRSLYLCDTCIKNQKKMRGIIKRYGLDEERFFKLLQELTDNG